MNDYAGLLRRLRYERPEPGDEFANASLIMTLNAAAEAIESLTEQLSNVRRATLLEIADQAGKTDGVPNGLLDEVAEVARAHQIAKDAEIADAQAARHSMTVFSGHLVPNAIAAEIAVSIRAQLDKAGA